MFDLLEQAIRYQYPETIPVSVNCLPAAWLERSDDFQKIADEFPQFFNGFKYDPNNFSYIERYSAHRWVDNWGCVWDNIHEGMDSIVTEHPIKCEEDVYKLEIPPQRNADFPHGFMYLRLLDLCGFELAMTMFADEGDELRTLISKVLEYNLNQVDSLIEMYPDSSMYSFGDDLGMQHSLAIGPEKWRKYLKPCFAEIYGRLKKSNPECLIYMHTDGCIWEIMQDLKDCGVDMVNPQFRANGLDNLVRVCKGKIPINLDLDRQMFPFATPSQIDDHIRECVEALYLPEGGLGLSIELDQFIPTQNIYAILNAAEKYRHYKG